MQKPIPLLLIMTVGPLLIGGCKSTSPVGYWTGRTETEHGKVETKMTILKSHGWQVEAVVRNEGGKLVGAEHAGGSWEHAEEGQIVLHREGTQSPGKAYVDGDTLVVTGLDPEGTSLRFTRSKEPTGPEDHSRQPAQ